MKAVMPPNPRPTSPAPGERAAPLSLSNSQHFRTGVLLSGILSGDSERFRVAISPKNGDARIIPLDYGADQTILTLPAKEVAAAALRFMAGLQNSGRAGLLVIDQAEREWVVASEMSLGNADLEQFKAGFREKATLLEVINSSKGQIPQVLFDCLMHPQLLGHVVELAASSSSQTTQDLLLEPLIYLAITRGNQTEQTRRLLTVLGNPKAQPQALVALQDILSIRGWKFSDFVRPISSGTESIELGRFFNLVTAALPQPTVAKKSTGYSGHRYYGIFDDRGYSINSQREILPRAYLFQMLEVLNTPIFKGAYNTLATQETRIRLDEFYSSFSAIEGAIVYNKAEAFYPKHALYPSPTITTQQVFPGVDGERDVFDKIRTTFRHLWK